jgi:hypothetical protein
VRPSSARTSTSQTIGVPLLAALLQSEHGTPTALGYSNAVLDENVLGRRTVEGRRRTYRQLRELYGLDPGRLEFRALLTLVRVAPAELPLLAGLVAFTTDPVFRASFEAVRAARPGEAVTSASLGAAVAEKFSTYSRSTLSKIGRNTAASWTQTGHLAGRTPKRRNLVDPGPAAVAMAVLLGHSRGRRGIGLFDTPWTTMLDRSPDQVRELVQRSGRLGYLSVHDGGGVVEVDISPLVGDVRA